MKSKLIVIILAAALSYNCSSSLGAQRGVNTGAGLLIGATGLMAGNMIIPAIDNAGQIASIDNRNSQPSMEINVFAGIAGVVGLMTFAASTASYANHNERRIDLQVSSIEQRIPETSEPSGGRVWDFASEFYYNYGSGDDQELRNAAIRCDAGQVAECIYFVQLVSLGLTSFNVEEDDLCNLTVAACQNSDDYNICALMEENCN